jgi:hypothetical protein
MLRHFSVLIAGQLHGLPVKVKTCQSINQQNKSIVQHAGVKSYIRNIVAWKSYNIKLANAQQAQVTCNFKDTEQTLLKSPRRRTTVQAKTCLSIN